MIISRARGYVFVHIPKTGGTALAQALEAHAHEDDLLIGDTPEALRRRGRLKGLRTSGRLWKHSRLSDLPGLLDEEEMMALFAFALVRNPWDRLVSYYHWLRAQTYEHPSVVLARALPFSDFALHPHTCRSLKGGQASVYMTLPSGREHCDAFVRLERFAQDIQPVEAKLGFPIVLPQGVNASERRPDWRPYYSHDAADAVARACAEDVERFGYAFDPQS